MKNKFPFLILLYIVMSTILTNAQTNVSGGIYSNTTWAKVNSPYIVTGNIVVFPGKSLTIEPGVIVKFDGMYNIEIRGELIAIGTVIDSISFISNNGMGINDSVLFSLGASFTVIDINTFNSDVFVSKIKWDGIHILNSSHNAAGLFRYCLMKNSFRGVSVECCGGNTSSYIKNSWFDNNDLASSGYSGWNLTIDNCVFTNNNMAIVGAHKVITNSTFMNNGIGINCEGAEARNCFFQNNWSAINWIEGTLGYVLVDSCTIIYNNLGIGIGGGPITNNIIGNNIIGVITSHQSSTENFTEYYVPIKYNHICNNVQFNIKNNNSSNKNITQNCFCTTDSATIESKIFDGYDDITLGLFNYDIYDSACQNITQSVYKIGTNPLSSNAAISNKPNISISQNPFNDFISIQVNNQSNQQYSLRIYNTLGQTVQRFENINSDQETIDCGNFKSGIYLLQLRQNGFIIDQRKIIKR